MNRRAHTNISGIPYWCYGGTLGRAVPVQGWKEALRATSGIEHKQNSFATFEFSSHKTNELLQIRRVRFGPILL